METKEQLHSFLPRHIRKLIQYTEKTPQALHPQKVGWLDMESTASRYESIGTTEEYNLYPDPNANKLCQQLADHHGVDKKQVCVGNGSTELLDLLLRTFCVPNQHKILAFSPVANRLMHLAKLSAIDVDIMPLEPNSHALPLIADEQLDSATRIIFIENPNSIIGSTVSSFDIVDIVGRFEGIVVVDESAIDYCPDHSLVSLIAQCPNLVILQSFSGLYGLAGIRVGVALAQKHIIEVLHLVKPTFSVNTIGQELATKALYVSDKKIRVLEKVNQQKEQLIQSLEKLEVIKRVYPSKTNTLLLEVEDAKGLVEFLKEEELIAVLNVSHQIGTLNCVRITIGHGKDNLRLLKALNDMKYNQSRARQILRVLSGSLRKASSFLGVFKKILGT